MKTLPLDKLEVFFLEAKHSGVFELYYTELSTGLRRGELLGIHWEDIDFDAGSIYIQRQITRLNGVVKESPLKTKNAYRQILVAPEVVQMLKEKKEREDGFSIYSFSSPTGGPMCPDSMLKMLHRVLKRAGMEEIPFHSLRHPYVKHTTKKYSLQKQKSQATVSDNLGFLFLLYWNRSCTLYSISILPPGYSRTLSIRRSARAVVRPVASASSFVMLFRWTCLSASSCSRFACAVNAA